MDITERKTAEDAMHKAQAELAHATRLMTMGKLIASIAHEINQPLGAIVCNGHACVRLLSREVPDVDKSRILIGRMMRDCMRASEVIAGIRSLAKKSSPEKISLDINETIQDVLAVTNNEVRRNSVWLRTELATGLPPVRGDRVQLQQVILNLVLNGIEAMKAVSDRPRLLVIRSKPHESEKVLVALQDSGIGLDPESVERLFEPFYTTKPEGMGMGLSISRSIIEAHGGRLWASPNDGPGATFQFTVPDDVNQQQ
jgi:C4-dicarboxylate-specific signal transduction histidine kinase